MIPEEDEGKKLPLDLERIREISKSPKEEK